MSTLTAIEPRPFVFKRAVAEIELVQATATDLKELIGYHSVTLKPIYGKRIGLIYWLKSNYKGIESTPRIITENCNPNDLKEWLDQGMIWIANKEF